MAPVHLAEDLAHIRALAEEGRNAPLIRGRYLALFGVLLAIAYAVHWMLVARSMGAAHALWLIGNWVAFGLCAGAGSLMIGRRVRAMPGHASIVNRVDATVWRGAVLCMVAVVVGAVAHDAINQDGTMENAIAAVGFAVYGVALGSTAAIAQQAWLSWFSRLSFATSALLWAFLGEPWTFLVAALASVLVLLVPGAVMMRGEPAGMD